MSKVDKLESANVGAAVAPAPRSADLIRNVVLVGHAACGKTTLVDALLVRAGALHRLGAVAEGNTVSDHDELEIRQQRSVFLSVASLEHRGIKVNLLDTPGTPDFVGELRAGLRAADAALFVVSAAQGLDSRTAQLWAECEAVGMPRAVVITQLDRPRADFDDAVALCQRLFGEQVLPLHLPVLDDEEQVAGLVDLLTMQIHDWSSGELQRRDPDPEHLTVLDGPRSALVEGLIAESEDETLLDRYVAGETLDPEALNRDFETAMARGTFYPVLAAAPLKGVGTTELLDLLVTGFPTPREHPLPLVSRPDNSPAEPIVCDADGPLVAEVIKTTTDPYVGRVSLVRIFSGTLTPDTLLHVSGHGPARPAHDEDERIGALSAPFGVTLRPVSSALAGDIVAVARLSHAETGDTLSSRENPLLMEAWTLPEPQLPIAVESSRADEDRLATALARLVAEDPTVRIERRAETGQQLLWCVGEAHAEVLLDRLRVRHSVEVTTPEVLIPLRETLASESTATGRLAKQTGGHGQYAVVVVQARPLPPGSGVQFATRVVGGSVPAAFHSSVETGVRAQAAQGITAGRPLIDLEIVLVDGKSHSVDSYDMAFQTAGATALRAAAEAAGVRTLEPIFAVSVLIPSAYVGHVMSDLAGRRAHVTGSETDAEHEDRSVVHAEVPEAELSRYAADLRALSHGTGGFTRRYLRHDSV